VILNCVDFFHHVSLNTVYTANVTRLDASSFSLTRFNNSALYRQAAWLTTQYAWPNPGSDPDRQIAIQAAIWNLFTPSAPDYAGSAAWITAAQTAYLTLNPA